MNRHIISLFCWIIAACCTNCDEGYIWHVTDFHYDPTYSSAAWSCEESSNRGKLGPYGNMWCDSPWALVESSVKAMKTIKPDVDFVLWTGDSVLHADEANLNYQYNSVILDNVTDLLKRSFDDVPVFATLGNHDAYPIDQFKPMNTLLYNETLERWRQWINDSSQDEHFRKGGYYSVKTSHNIRIVALNTMLYHKPNKAVKSEGDPAGQFDWLVKTLKTARRQSEKVIITAHISPGANAFGLFDLYPQQNDRLTTILTQYSDVIVAMHFGHEHADAMKLLRGVTGAAVTPVFLAPSVTPIIGFGPSHNPGIRLIKYDRANGKHLDIFQYYLDYNEANEGGATSWKLEYTLTKAYGLLDLSATSLHTVTDKMNDLDSEEFKNYWKYYFVSPDGAFTKTCDQKCHAVVVCGFTEFIKADFDKCMDSKGYMVNYVDFNSNTSNSSVTVGISFWNNLHCLLLVLAMLLVM